MTNSLMRRPFRLLPLLVMVMTIAAAACSSGTAVESGTTTEPSTTSTTTEPTTTTTTTTEAPTGPTPPESMPGDVIEFGPTAGDQIAVVGVAHDDELNVRIAPGTEFEIIETLDPLADEVIALGENRLLASSFWVEIQTADGPGWVNEAFVGFLGVSRELDSDVVATDAVAIGQGIAAGYVSTEPPSRVTLVANEGETVIYDVLDIGDDAVKGYRLTLVTEPVSGGTGVASFTEQTICSRGLAQDLRCV